MSGVHLHLLINHVPILGSIAASLLLLLSLKYAPEVMQRMAYVLLILVAIGGIAAKFSGEPAEDAVRGMPGITRAAIHAHEDMADKAYLLAAAMGVVALVLLFRYGRTRTPQLITVLCIAGTMFTSGAMVYTGLLGGMVRHTEVRTGATAADAQAIEPPRVRRPPPTADSVPH